MQPRLVPNPPPQIEVNPPASGNLSLLVRGIMILIMKPAAAVIASGKAPLAARAEATGTEPPPPQLPRENPVLADRARS
jgi:hypothetical protein